MNRVNCKKIINNSSAFFCLYFENVYKIPFSLFYELGIFVLSIDFVECENFSDCFSLYKSTNVYLEQCKRHLL